MAAQAYLRRSMLYSAKYVGPTHGTPQVFSTPFFFDGSISSCSVIQILIPSLNSLFTATSPLSLVLEQKKGKLSSPTLAKIGSLVPVAPIRTPISLNIIVHFLLFLSPAPI